MDTDNQTYQDFLSQFREYLDSNGLIQLEDLKIFKGFKIGISGKMFTNMLYSNLKVNLFTGLNKCHIQNEIKQFKEIF